MEVQEQEEQDFKKPVASSSEQEGKQGLVSRIDDGQLAMGLALVACVSRAGNAYLPEQPVVQLLAALEMLLVLICLLSSTQRGQQSRVHIGSIILKAILMAVLYLVELVIPFVDELGLVQGAAGHNVGSMLSMGGCVLALVIVFLSSAESQVSRWVTQVTALFSILVGAYLPCLLHEAHSQGACKLPTTNFLVVTLCVTFSSMLSSAARFQRNRSSNFKWRTKDGVLVSKLG